MSLSQRNHIILYVFLMLLLTSSHCNADSAEIITFIYPPYTRGDGSGILEKVVSTAASQASIDIVWQYYPRKRSVLQYQEKKSTSLYLGERSYFPSIADELTAKSLLNIRTVFVFLKQRYPDFQYSGVSDLKGKRIGVTLGSIYVSYFEKNGLLVDAAPLEKQVKKLMKRRLDFWHTVDVTAINMIEENYPGKRDMFRFVEEAHLTVELLVKKGSSVEPLHAKLSGAVDAIVKSGLYLELLEQYYGKDLVPERVMIH